MKIGVDIRVLMDKNYSGVSKYTANLLTALFKIEQENLSNEYRLFYNSWHNLKSRLGVWENSFSKIKSSSWPNKIFNYILQKVFSYPKIDLFLDKPDIFWSPHFNFSSFSSTSATKKIITVHDLSFLRYPEFFSCRKNFWHRALNVKKTLMQADAIVAVSENTKNDIIELLDISPEKIKVIYSGINLPLNLNNHSNDLAVEFFRKHNIEKYYQKGFILYVGTIEPRKNLVNLIKAYELWRLSLNENDKILPLILVGAKGWKTNSIFSTWRKSVYKEDIHFLGYVKDEERELLYHYSSLFVYPSFYEGFGFPPLEAMARGLPVISSNVSSLPEVVADAALMVDPNKAEEIAIAIKDIFHDEDYRQQLIAKGKQRVALFSWDKTAKQYLEFFAELKNKIN